MKNLAKVTALQVDHCYNSGNPNFGTPTLSDGDLLKTVYIPRKNSCEITLHGVQAIDTHHGRQDRLAHRGGSCPGRDESGPYAPAGAGQFAPAGAWATDAG